MGKLQEREKRLRLRLGFGIMETHVHDSGHSLYWHPKGWTEDHQYEAREATPDEVKLWNLCLRLMAKNEKKDKRIVGMIEYAIEAPDLESCKVILCDVLSGLPIYGADDLHLRDRPEWNAVARKFRVSLDARSPDENP